MLVNATKSYRFAPNGTTVTSTIDSGLFPGKSGIKNLAGLIRGYFNQGGMQFQPNLIDRKVLLDAYKSPGKHRDLVVCWVLRLLRRSVEGVEGGDH